MVLLLGENLRSIAVSFASVLFCLIVGREARGTFYQIKWKFYYQRRASFLLIGNVGLMFGDSHKISIQVGVF